VAKPILMVVDADPEALSVLEQTLQRRYAADYQIHTANSPTGGLAVLERLSARGGQVALLVAAQSPPQLTGAAFLARAHQLYLAAKRVLLVPMGGQAAAAVLQAMTLGQIDDDSVRPWGHPEERLYPPIGELLSAWMKTTGRARLAAIRVVGRHRSPRSHQLRDLLERNGVAWLVLRRLRRGTPAPSGSPPGWDAAAGGGDVGWPGAGRPVGGRDRRRRRRRDPTRSRRL